MKKNILLNYLLEGKEKEISTEELLSIMFSYKINSKFHLSKTKRLLKKFNNLYGLDKTKIKDFTANGETTDEQYILLKLALELGKRWIHESEEPLIEVNHSYAVFRYIYPQMKSLSKEIFKILLLNSHNQIIKNVNAFKGTVTEAPAYIRDVFEISLKYHAVSFILVHNHPSGYSSPSHKDKIITKKLVIAGDMLKIPLNDHIIIGEKEYFSFLDQGLINNYRGISSNINKYNFD